MAKITGLTTQVSVDDSGSVARDISNDIRSVSFRTTRGMQDVTGLDKSAMERLLVLADGHVEIKGVFNAAANKSHDVFKTVVSSIVARVVAIVLPGAAATLTMTCIFSDYAIDRNERGELTFTATGDLSSGTAPVWS